MQHDLLSYRTLKSNEKVFVRSQAVAFQKILLAESDYYHRSRDEARTGSRQQRRSAQRIPTPARRLPQMVPDTFDRPCKRRL